LPELPGGGGAGVVPLPVDGLPVFCGGEVCSDPDVPGILLPGAPDEAPGGTSPRFSAPGEHAAQNRSSSKNPNKHVNLLVILIIRIPLKNLFYVEAMLCYNYSTFLLIIILT